MASKNSEKTVEQKLSELIDLQQILSKIDHIKFLRGELPLEVQDIEDEIEGIKTRLGNLESDNKKQTQMVSFEKTKISNATDLIEKYNEQLTNVKNNREYDNLSKEIEFQGLEIELSNKKIKEYNSDISVRKDKIASLKNTLDERAEDLSVKKQELEHITSETQEEEIRLEDSARKMSQEIEERLLMAFERIRGGARNGLAVVAVDRDACGGCFNKIPPQRQLDVKLRKKIITCEYCGRILVDRLLMEEKGLL